MEITINTLLIPILDKLALENKLTSEEYASNIVTTFLESQYRGAVLDKIKLAKIEDLKILKEETLSNLTIKK